MACAADVKHAHRSLVRYSHVYPEYTIALHALTNEIILAIISVLFLAQFKVEVGYG